MSICFFTLDHVERCHGIGVAKGVVIAHFWLDNTHFVNHHHLSYFSLIISTHEGKSSLKMSVSPDLITKTSYTMVPAWCDRKVNVITSPPSRRAKFLFLLKCASRYAPLLSFITFLKIYPNWIALLWGIKTGIFSSVCYSVQTESRWVIVSLILKIGP